MQKETISASFRAYEQIPFSDFSTAILHMVDTSGRHFIAVNLGGVFVPQDLTEGTVVSLVGSYRNSAPTSEWPYYGRRVFDFGKIEIVAPPTVAAAIDYLSHIGIKGLKEGKAKRIVEVTGPDIAAFFEKYPDEKSLFRFLEEKKKTGVKMLYDETLLLKIKSRITATFATRTLFDSISRYGFTYRDTDKLYKYVEEMENRPCAASEILAAVTPGDRYLSIYDYRVLPFEASDRLAAHLGYSAMDERRIARLCETVLQKNEMNGNIWLSADSLYKYIVTHRRETGFPDDILPRQEMDSVIAARTDLFVSEKNGERLYLYNMWNHEQSAAENACRISRAGHRLPFTPELVELAEAEAGIRFSGSQKACFDFLRTTGLKLLTGGAGTGKTTTISGLIYAYHRMYPQGKIALCAPTGRAAKRMTELCRRYADIFTASESAMTIHRLLHYLPNGDTVDTFYNSSNPLPYDMVIVDEASMLDTEMFDMLIRAMNEGATLLLCGDANQLPSVGCGNVFGDLLASGEFESVSLSVNYRQKDNTNGNILLNANTVNAGCPNMTTGPDFEIIECETDEKMADIITSVVKKDMISGNGRPTLLSPTHKGPAGVDTLNAVLQPVLNPNNPSVIMIDQRGFRAGDPVVFNHNDYDLGVTNGDIGIITSITPADMIVDVDGIGSKTIGGKSLKELSLAYAMTVHKAQGSEYDHVIIALPEAAICMMARNMLYTAITRARRKVTIVTVPGMITRAAGTDTTEQRRTTLRSLVSYFSTSEVP